mmetsp:Transcript_51610/g.149872  ORF Transcript_51610/g.149872 Transcript_51610/m.149872 type:complete len:83 (-) Transcript_51610:22-270(-)
MPAGLKCLRHARDAQKLEFHWPLLNKVATAIHTKRQGLNHPVGALLAVAAQEEFSSKRQAVERQSTSKGRGLKANKQNGNEA